MVPNLSTHPDVLHLHHFQHEMLISRAIVTNVVMMSVFSEVFVIHTAKNCEGPVG